ncbi:MAG: hypothetical protein IJF56_02585 [Clostridia bacterium]|nr:hypothetical protein [Clostridia bacterium]
MKTFAKRAAALLLAIVLTFSLAGCYSSEMTWAARMGDDELPIGAYIYFLSTAYNEAAGQMDTDTKVLKSQIDGMDAGDWILDRANFYVNQYFWVEQEMDRLGLSLDEADYELALINTDNYWAYFGTLFEQYGIARTSFDVAYSQYNLKYLKIFEAMYGEGGEREIPAEDLMQQYISTYYSYEYFLAPMNTVAEDESVVEFTEEEKAALAEKLEAVKKDIESGKTTVTEAASEYAREQGEESSTYQIGVNTRQMMEQNYLPDTFIETITSMKANDVAVFEAGSYMVLARLLPIEETAESIIEDADSRLTLMIALKTDEFHSHVESCAKEMTGVELNKKAISRYKPSMFKESGEYGLLTPETAE